MRSRAKFRVRTRTREIEISLAGNHEIKTHKWPVKKKRHRSVLPKRQRLSTVFRIRTIRISHDFPYDVPNLLATCCVVSLVNVLLEFNFSLGVSVRFCTNLGGCGCGTCCCTCSMPLHLHLQGRNRWSLSRDLPDVKA